MGSIDFRSLQPSRKRNLDVGRETQSLPCNLNDEEGKHGPVTQCLADMVPQIPQIQGPMADGIASGLFVNKDHPETSGKENATKNKHERKTSKQTAGVLQRIRVEPFTEIIQNRVYPGPTGKCENPQTKAVEVENEADQLPSSETNLLCAGSSLRTRQAAPAPDAIVRTFKAPKRFVSEENGKENTCSTESEYGPINISGPAEARLQNVLDEEKIPNSINGNPSETTDIRPVEENLNTKNDTLTHSNSTRGRYQERQMSNEIDGSRVERPHSQNGSREAYRLPRPLSSRAPHTQEEGSLQPRDKITGCSNKTGKDAKSGPCPPKYTGYSHRKNAKDIVKLFSDHEIGSFPDCAELGHLEEFDSLSSIPSLASLTAPSLDSSTDASWTSSGEPGSENQDREQTTLKQFWNTATHVTLQRPATSLSDEANISPPVQETRPSDLLSNDQVTSSEGSEEYDFRSDPPSGEIQHGREVATVDVEGEREGVADRRQANIIQELSECFLFLPLC